MRLHGRRALLGLTLAVAVSYARCFQAPSRHLHPRAAGLLHGRSPAPGVKRCATDTQSRAGQTGAADIEMRRLLPIFLGVFVQMLGEGIAISSLPLHLTSFGASPVQVGAATSCFSVAQLVCCPLLVKWSGRKGRAAMLRICLAGAAASNLFIAMARGTTGVILARFLAGCFAASVPVAQAAVTELVSSEVAPIALSRVSAASQMGIVVGPAVSAMLIAIFSRLGLAPGLMVPAIFAACGAMALGLVAVGQQDRVPDSTGAKKSKAAEVGGSAQRQPKFVQWLLRLIALTVGWSLTLSVLVYCLFSSRFLGYDQVALSSTFSVGAALTVLTQLFLFPRLVKKFGPHSSCTLGLVTVGCGLGGCSMLRQQPIHQIMYFSNRIGSGIADTCTATLVAETSENDEERASNFAMIQSSRAATRIVSPMLSGRMFQVSCAQGGATAGALPYLVCSLLALLLSPVPLAIKRISKRIA